MERGEEPEKGYRTQIAAAAISLYIALAVGGVLQWVLFYSKGTNTEIVLKAVVSTLLTGRITVTVVLFVYAVIVPTFGRDMDRGWVRHFLLYLVFWLLVSPATYFENLDFFKAAFDTVAAK